MLIRKGRPEIRCIRATLIGDQSGPFCSGKRERIAVPSEGFLGQIPLKGGSGDPEDLGGLTGAQPLHPGPLKPRDDGARAAQRPPPTLGPLEACWTRSTMRAFSNSARAARTWSCKRPAGVVQSMPSPNETNATPNSCSWSRSVTRCFKLRPSRSRRQQTSTSKQRRLASLTSSSSAGRCSTAR